MHMCVEWGSEPWVHVALCRARDQAQGRGAAMREAQDWGASAWGVMQVGGIPLPLRALDC
jgi:hypothetical protein